MYTVSIIKLHTNCYRAQSPINDVSTSDPHYSKITALLYIANSHLRTSTPLTAASSAKDDNHEHEIADVHCEYNKWRLLLY